MKTNNIQNAVEAALVADSYLLGAHWIYNPEELKNLKIDWNECNAPCAQWHEGKEKGDFTHYGDQAKWLALYVSQNKSFDIKKFKQLWLENMKEFKGYMDGSCKDTLKIMQEDGNALLGSNSHDLALVGSIAPLLFVSSSKKEFLSNVESYIAFTHNNETVLHVAKLFATVLYNVSSGDSIKDALANASVDKAIQIAFDVGITSKDKDTVTGIQEFGPGCPVERNSSPISYL